MKLNTNSNVYTIVYASVMVIIVAFLLAFVSSALKATQDANVANDKRGQILAALNLRDVKNVEEIYHQTIIADPIINVKGEVVKEKGGFEVDSKLITAKNDQDKQLPLYVAKVNNDTIYVVPLYGRGLWGGIYGYLALKKDFRTVYGANYGHESETAGLGAEIKDNKAWQDKFKGKNILDAQKQHIIFSVTKKVEQPNNQVDAVTGATLTSNGVSEMFHNEKGGLAPYIKFLTEK